MSSEVLLVGHPYSSTGMGEQLRACLQALRSAQFSPKVFDIYRFAPRTDAGHEALISTAESHHLNASRIRLFHINGNEIEASLAHLEAQGGSFGAGYNIIMPAWELPRYPSVWAKALKKFDEVWAISRFVQDILASAGHRAYYMGQSVEVPPRAFLPRRFFGLRESAFTLLHFFDTSSFAARKNPSAVIELYRAAKKARPLADLQLVLKVKTGDDAADEWARTLQEKVPDAKLISNRLDTYELHSLIAASDCFLSLHRAEGFGRGTGEAMSLGALAMATGWSGNLDYMTNKNSLLVDHRLIPVRSGDYPHWKGQHWAEPNIDHALSLLLKAIDSPIWCRTIRERGRMDVLRTMGHRAVGLRMAHRLNLLNRNKA